MTKENERSWQPLVKILCSTRAMEKEQEPMLSHLQANQWEGHGKYQGPAAGNTQRKAIPQIPTRCPDRVNAED